MSSAKPKELAAFLAAFFEELVLWGVHEAVVCPGSRSTPLAMCAWELSRRFPGRLRVSVVLDERSAAFMALGMGKATGRPAALVCTSGSAVAHFYPAVLEAESSRVPLLVLSADRPARLQGLGAPQTCDQLHMYGSHVRAFRQMPQPSASAEDLRFARQAAREALIAACPYGSSSCFGGPAHLNFAFEEPLMPDFSDGDLFEKLSQGLVVGANPSGILAPESRLNLKDAENLAEFLKGKKILLCAGEGTAETQQQARSLLRWAEGAHIAVWADVLSGLRVFDSYCLIDNYDAVLADISKGAGRLQPEVIIRFGRWPISKSACAFALDTQAFQLVVDPFESRDFNSFTGAFAAMRPADFVQSMAQVAACGNADFVEAWKEVSAAAPEYVYDRNMCKAVETVFENAGANSLLFVANSLSVRLADAQLRCGTALRVLCNRGLNGIDGTLSCAAGALLAASLQDEVLHPEAFGANAIAPVSHTLTLITGDLALQHDIGAFALQKELLAQAGMPLHLPIILLNNHGGGIFDLLPQKSADEYFERLFITPQELDFKALAQAFDVPYFLAEDTSSLAEFYAQAQATPGMSLLEVPLAPAGGTSAAHAF